MHRGNRLGIQHELCGTQQTRAQWLDANRVRYWTGELRRTPGDPSAEEVVETVRNGIAVPRRR